MPTNYYLQIKPQIHQILEASEAIMDTQFDPSQSTRTFVLSSVMTEISVVISGVLPKMIERAPKVRLDLSKHDNEIAAVSEGKADFAVIAARRHNSCHGFKHCINSAVIGAPG